MSPAFERFLWQFVWGSLYGVAFLGLGANAAFIMLPDNVWPSAMQWVKLGVTLFGLYCGGIFTYMRNPTKAWDNAPSPKP